MRIEGDLLYEEKIIKTNKILSFVLICCKCNG